MALYGYTVIAGIIIWCGVTMGTWGPAGIFVVGGGKPKMTPTCTKKKSFLVVSPVKNIHQVLMSKKFKIKFRYISRVRSILEFR